MVSLDPVRKQVIESAQDRVRASASLLLNQLRDEVPVAEGGGTMRDSITVNPSGFSLEVRVAVDYATYVIEGTPPHRIPRSGNKLLAFEWDVVGGLAFFMNVEHPGTQPNDWYHPVLEDWVKVLDRLPVTS